MTLDTTIDEGELGHILAHETLAGRFNNGEDILSDVFANRPAATAVEAGTLFWATDTNVLYRSDGATWSALAAGVTDHGALTGLTPDDDHSHYLKEKASGGLASEVPTHAHTGASEAGTVPGADTTAIHDNEAGEINAITAKATPVGADMVLIEDSAASNAKKKVVLSDLGLGIDHADLVGLTSGDPHTQYVQESIVDAKGDLIVGTASDTVARRAVGANGTVLTADSAESDGVKWATPAGGGTFVHKTADESTSSTTMQDDDHLSFTIDANGKYAFEAVLIFTAASSTEHAKIQWVEPDGTFSMLVQRVRTDNTGLTSTQQEGGGFNQATSPLVLTIGNGSSGGTIVAHFIGLIEAGGTGGTFKLQWASTNATSVTHETGSWLSYKKLN